MLSTSLNSGVVYQKSERRCSGQPVPEKIQEVCQCLKRSRKSFAGTNSRYIREWYSVRVREPSILSEGLRHRIEAAHRGKRGVAAGRCVSQAVCRRERESINLWQALKPCAEPQPILPARDPQSGLYWFINFIYSKSYYSFDRPRVRYIPIIKT